MLFYVDEDCSDFFVSVESSKITLDDTKDMILSLLELSKPTLVC